MRKSLVVGMVAVLVAVSAVTASAAAAAAIEPATAGQVAVAFSGTSTFDFTAPTCGIVEQVFDATMSTRSGVVTLLVNGCVIPALVGPYTFEGSFTISSAHRVELSGTATGSIGGTSPPSCAPGLFGASFDFALASTAGAAIHTITALEMAGTWCSPGTPDVPGPINGTVAVALAQGLDSL
jgi:hypothetical protein